VFVLRALQPRLQSVLLAREVTNEHEVASLNHSFLLQVASLNRLLLDRLSVPQCFRLGFQVSGFGFRGWGCGSWVGVQVSGFRIQGAGFRVRGLWSGVGGEGLRVNG